MERAIQLTNEDMVREYQSGNEEMITQLIQKNLGLVYRFAKRLYPTINKTPFDQDDLIQEGLIGFMESVKKYRFHEDVKFSTYAADTVWYAMLTFINRRAIYREYKNNPNSKHVHLTSLTELIPGSADLTLEDVIQDENAQTSFVAIEDEIDNKILREDLLKLLDDVLAKGKLNVGLRILKVRYGLNGLPLTFREIGDLYDLSIERVRQLHNKAIWKIRASSEGQAFMEKYQWVVINAIHNDRESVSEFMDVSKIICNLETIDELINNVLGACG